MDTKLKEINDIVGDDIPEVIFREGMFCWKLHNKREPKQPFLVCRYEAFERLSQYLGYRPDHVKASLKREPYACFELDLRRASKKESWQLLVIPVETRFKAEGRGQKAEGGVRKKEEVKFADFRLFIRRVREFISLVLTSL